MSISVPEGGSPYATVLRLLDGTCEVCGVTGHLTPAEHMGVNRRVPEAVAYCASPAERPCGMTYGLTVEGKVRRTGFIPR